LNNKQIDAVFKRFFKNKNIALALINNSFLSPEYQEKYLDLLERRYSILEK